MVARQALATAVGKPGVQPTAASKVSTNTEQKLEKLATLKLERETRASTRGSEVATKTGTTGLANTGATTARGTIPKSTTGSASTIKEQPKGEPKIEDKKQPESASKLGGLRRPGAIAVGATASGVKVESGADLKLS